MIDLGLLKSIVDLIRSAGGLIKPKGKLKELAKNTDFQQEFLKQNGNNLIINVKGDFYLGDLSFLDNKDTLFDGFKKPLEQSKKDVSLLHYEFYPRVNKFSRTKIFDKDVTKYSSYLNPINKNILSMSIYVKTLYDEGNKEEGNKVRSDIGNQFGSSGRKFCNLYLQGYIHSYVEYLILKYGEEELKRVFNSELMHFVENSDSILFIHHYTDMKRIYFRMLYAINHNEDYIALHAGGEINIKILLEFIEQYKKEIYGRGYYIKTEIIESKTKTRLCNVYITKNKKV